MSSFARKAKEWQDADEDAKTSGSKAARERAEQLRQEVRDSPEAQRARRSLGGQPAPRPRR